MPRKPRYLSRTKYYHIMTQGINKSYIFDDEIDMSEYCLRKLYNENLSPDEQKISE